MLSEITNAYANHLTSGTSALSGNVERDAFANDQVLGGLIRLSDQIAELLVPVAPAPEFVHRLGTRLTAAAAPCEIRIGHQSRQRFWLGALLSGSLVSATGFVLVWVLLRGRRATMLAG
jgi:hypothetical protein